MGLVVDSIVPFEGLKCFSTIWIYTSGLLGLIYLALIGLIRAMIMKLDPRIVVQFVVIAEEASFTRAARRLHVAQPWLSGRIKRFEEQLGFSLFVRNAHGIELTSKGPHCLRWHTVLSYL